MATRTGDVFDQNELDDKQKEDGSKEAWSCAYRMYHCVLSLPVLCLMGVVLVLGGHFEGDITQFRQALLDLRTSCNLLNITRHISEESALSHLFWLHQSEDVREDLHQHMTVTDQLLLNPIQWLPTACLVSLRLREDSSSLVQRFLRAREGAEFNEAPSRLDREEFHHLVLSLAVCSLADVSADPLREETKPDLRYHHLLASCVLVQHLTVWRNYECRYAPENVSSLPTSGLGQASAHAVFAGFISSGELFWFGSVSPLTSPHRPCSEERLLDLEKRLELLTEQTVKARESFQRTTERLLWESYVDLVIRSALIAATVVGICVALYLFSSISRRSREMARGAVRISRSLRAQCEEKEKLLDLCIPRLACQQPGSMSLSYSYSEPDGCPVSATVLALEIPDLGHVVRDGDRSAALWAMTHILTLVEEKVAKHQAFVLKQHAAEYLIAAVSSDVHCSNWPLCSVADLALDLTTSLADVELTNLTPDCHLRPLFGIHTGQAIGYLGRGSPVRYCVVGDIVSSAVRCQRLCAPNCIRLTWDAYCALRRLGNYICVESDGSSTEDCSPTPPESGPALYLAGKRTSPVALKPTTITAPAATAWIFHYV